MIDPARADQAEPEPRLLRGLGLLASQAEHPAGNGPQMAAVSNLDQDGQQAGVHRWTLVSVIGTDRTATGLAIRAGTAGPN